MPSSNTLAESRPPHLCNPDHCSQSDPTHCLNHQDKLATHSLFSVETDQFLHYCQKCSIMLASQGFNIQKLQPQPVISWIQLLKRNDLDNSGRKTEIDDFLTELQSVMQELHTKRQALDSELVHSEISYNNIISNVSQFFEKIEDCLALQKYTTFNSILTHRVTNQRQCRELRNNLASAIENIKTIDNDIQTNLSAAYTVQNSLYQSIMQNYATQIQPIHLILKLECSKMTQLHVDVPDLPAHFQQISSKFSFQEIIFNSQASSQNNKQIKQRSSKKSLQQEILKQNFDLSSSHRRYNKDIQIQTRNHKQSFKTKQINQASMNRRLNETSDSKNNVDSQSKLHFRMPLTHVSYNSSISNLNLCQQNVDFLGNKCYSSKWSDKNSLSDRNIEKNLVKQVHLTLIKEKDDEEVEVCNNSFLMDEEDDVIVSQKISFCESERNYQKVTRELQKLLMD